MPRVAVGVVIAACIAAGCEKVEEPPGRVRVSNPGNSNPGDHNKAPGRGVDSETPAEPAVSVLEVTEAEFDNVVLMSMRPVLVSFQPSWSNTSRSLQPTIEELAADFEGRATIVRVADPQLIARYQVRSFPTVFVFVNGRVVDESLGVKPKEELAQLLTNQLNPPLERTASLTPDALPPVAPPMPTADTGTTGTNTVTRTSTGAPK